MMKTEIKVLIPSLLDIVDTLVSVDCASAGILDEESQKPSSSSPGEEDSNSEESTSSDDKLTTKVPAVISKTYIPQGTVFQWEEGEIQSFSLTAPLLHQNSYSWCLERISEKSDSLATNNWIGFLQSGSRDNLELRHTSSEQLEFVTSRSIKPHTQLIISENTAQQVSFWLQNNSRTNEAPLDLSKSIEAVFGEHGMLKSKSHHTTSLNKDNKKDTEDKPTSSEDKSPPAPQPRHSFSITAVLQNCKTPPLPSKTTLATLTSDALSPRPSAESPPHNQNEHGRKNCTVFLGRPILRTRGRERSLLPCEVCGKAFDRPSLLKRHMRTHTGEKPHVCDVCSKGFSTSSSLNTHRRIHSGEKPHQCPICGKRFTASSNLYYHRMTHNKEKPHKCMLCGKSFPTPGDLKSHQYVHSGSWPYNCPVCHRGFSKQTNLRNHLLLHSGDKPHNCHLCGKKFALACNLRAHLRTHDEESQSSSTAAGNSVTSCISCKRSFLSSLNMIQNGRCPSCVLLCMDKQSGMGRNIPIPSSVIGSGAISAASPTSPLLPSLQFLGPLAAAASASASWSRLPASDEVVDSRNPFLEQLFQWNYRFAKETAGSLSMMQQKLIESQMLAAQLMMGSPSAIGSPATNLSSGSANPSSNPIGLSVSEIIQQSRNPLQFPVDLNMNKFMAP